MINTERLKEIEELAAAATDGPLAIELTCNMPEDARLFRIWEQSSYREGEPLAKGKNGNVGRLFSASRTVIPELLAEVRRLREVLGFYADKKNHDAEVSYKDGLYTLYYPMNADQGQRARDALGGCDKKTRRTLIEMRGMFAERYKLEKEQP